MQLSQDSQETIVKFLQEKLNPELIYLYGSFAQGEGRKDSDIDLAVCTDPRKCRAFLLANELAQRLRRDVDLVELRSFDRVQGTGDNKWKTPLL